MGGSPSHPPRGPGPCGRGSPICPFPTSQLPGASTPERRGSLLHETKRGLVDTGQGRDTNRSALPGGAGHLGVALVSLGKAGEFPGHHTLGVVILPRETWRESGGHRVSVEAEPEARLQSPSHCCGCFPTISPISQGPSLRFLTSSSPYQIPALHPRPETWWVLCYMNNTGGVGPGWTGGTRYGQQTDSVHREDETLPPGEAWPQEVLLTQQ